MLDGQYKSTNTALALELTATGAIGASQPARRAARPAARPAPPSLRSGAARPVAAKEVLPAVAETLPPFVQGFQSMLGLTGTADKDGGKRTSKAERDRPPPAATAATACCRCAWRDASSRCGCCTSSRTPRRSRGTASRSIRRTRATPRSPSRSPTRARSEEAKQLVRNRPQWSLQRRFPTRRWRRSSRGVQLQRRRHATAAPAHATATTARGDGGGGARQRSGLEKYLDRRALFRQAFPDQHFEILEPTRSTRQGRARRAS